MTWRYAVYNENDPFCAQWARNLVAAGMVPNGEVDERSICDVQPGDYRGFAQVHLFAGILGWPLALRLAGWPDDRPVLSGSAPCQPFSVSGKRRGTDDKRHLWPEMFRLVRGLRPAILVGEQVSGAAGYGWLDGVQSDLEGEGYASRALDIPACAVNAPHIRKRIWWVAIREDFAGDGSGATRDGPVGHAPGTAGERFDGRLPGPQAGERRTGQFDGHNLFGPEPATASDGGTGPGRDMADSDQPVLCGFAPAGEQPLLQPYPGTGSRPAQHLGRAQRSAGLGMADPYDGRDDQRQGEIRARYIGPVAGRPLIRPGRRDDILGDRNMADGLGTDAPVTGVPTLRPSGGFDLGDRSCKGLERCAALDGHDAGELAPAERADASHGLDLTGGAQRSSTLGTSLDLGDSKGLRPSPGSGNGSGRSGPFVARGMENSQPGRHASDGNDRFQPTGGAKFWDGAGWIICHDGKARRAESRIPLLVDGIRGRVAVSRAVGRPVAEESQETWVNRTGLWRGFGNAIVSPLAAELIKALMECMP